MSIPIMPRRALEFLTRLQDDLRLALFRHWEFYREVFLSFCQNKTIAIGHRENTFDFSCVFYVKYFCTSSHFKYDLDDLWGIWRLRLKHLWNGRYIQSGKPPSRWLVGGNFKHLINFLLWTGFNAIHSRWYRRRIIRGC